MASAIGWLAVAAGVFGTLIGSFLNVVAWRVPRGESLLPDSHCPRCNAPIKPWQNVPIVSWIALRGKCASCGERISVRYPLVELGTGIAFVLVTLWAALAMPAAGFGAAGFGSADAGVIEDPAAWLTSPSWWIALAAFLWFAAASIALTIIDIEHHRLPNRVVIPSLIVVLSLLTAATLIDQDIARLTSTLGGAATLFALYFVIVFAYPRGMGGGDVKLAPLVGGVLGYVGWPALAVGGFAGFVFGAVFGVVLMIMGRAGRRSAIPFGPFMLAGGWFGMILGDPVWNAYLRLTGFS